MRIGTRLVVAYLSVLLATFVVLALSIPRLTEALVIRSVRSELAEQARALARLIENSPNQNAARGIIFSFDRFSSNAQALIVDQNGRIIATTERFKKLRSKQLPPLIERKSRLKGTTVSIDLFEEGEALVAREQIGTSGHRLILVRPLRQLHAFARPITASLLVIMVLAVAAALLVIALVSRGMVVRLKETGAAAHRLAEGDLASRAPVRGRDEIADLAGHFNHMAERLQVLVEGMRRSETMRRELLINVSHELRTPMTSIQGFAEALRDQVVADPERRQRYLEIIAQESGRLSRLVTDLFDVAKLEAGQIELRLQTISLTSWLVDVAEQGRQIAAPSGVEIDLQVAPEAEAARLHGDGDRLSQVMTNLLHNAVRFSPSGGTVTIGAGLEGDRIRITVRDHGPGIPPDEKERVFERFFQGQTKGTTAHKGAGLGLAIVRSLILAHGGEIGVESTPGEGATFWFTLQQAH